MQKYLCRLEFDLQDDPESPFENEHGELCCLVDAERMDDVPDALEKLIERLRGEGKALGRARHIFLDDIFELTTAPGAAVLWSNTWMPMPDNQPGYASIHGTLLLDDSGTLRAAGWSAGNADEDNGLPFMDFTEDEPTPPPDTPPKRGRSSKSPTSRSKKKPKPKPDANRGDPFDWKKKPIIEFTELERKRWHDDMGAKLEEPMIAEARDGHGSLLVAAAVLILPTGEARLLSHCGEWGDGEGSTLPEHMAAIAQQELKPEERACLDLVEIRMSSDGTCSCVARAGDAVRHEDVDDILAPGLTKRLAGARRETEDADYWLAILTTANGAKRIVFADHDDGVGEVRRETAEFVLRARRMNWLKPGESFDRARLKLRPLGALAWTAAITMDPVANVRR